MTLEVADVYDRGKYLRQENKQKRYHSYDQIARDCQMKIWMKGKCMKR